MTDICKNYHKGNKMSVAAHEKLMRSKNSIKRKVYDYIKENPDSTCEQVEFALLLKHQTCSARFSELKRDGLVVISGEEETTSGCNAATYRVND